MMDMAATPFVFSGLRRDLRILEGPRDPQGEPTWTLLDPARHRFFRLGRVEVEILKRLEKGDPERIAREVAASTAQPVGTERVTELVRFLTENLLVNAQGGAELERLQHLVSTQKRNWASVLLHAYLFFRIPLIQPDRLLTRLIPWVDWMFSRRFIRGLSVAALVGLYLTGRQWEAFLATFPHLFSWQGILLFAITLSLVKIVHELGHACAAKRFGCHIPTMGIAFLVMWPVLYTDTTDAWRLTSRRERLIIVAAGVLAELVLAVLATLAWSFLADGALRSSVFFIATSSWLITLGINLSPFLRFDGYYLLSDWVEVENLHERAAAMGRWWLRRWLFGWRQDCPEALPKYRVRFLILFAYLTWLYRLILFLGIALLVYHFFFKLAGIFLFLVEIGWFVLMPIGQEVGVWIRERENIRINRNTLRTVIFFGLLICLSAVPWSTQVEAPAVLRKERPQCLFSQAGGRVTKFNATEGDHVEKGNLLAHIEAPDLDYEVDQLKHRIALSRWKLEFQGMNASLSEQLPIVQHELQASLSEHQGLLEKRKKLEIVAPFSGIVVRTAEHLQEGDWIGENELLLELVRPGGWILEAYVEESNLGRIGIDSRGTFYPETLEWPTIEVTTSRIDPTATKKLDDPWLVSTFKGDIPVREDKEGQWIPEFSIYRVLLVPSRVVENQDQLLRGTVHLQGTPRSLFTRTWKMLLSVFVRESGF
ncbi:MAG: hypothetical protein HW380_2892 [Magnetococcales bacterium]|nr:hypothetical protein [Magnetococcales bacterium]HIJ83148.1 HlyD family efflux transporter periplasmic adaptor subunit [Magnetococcales bacterium]